VSALNDAELVACEYSTSERLELRRHDATGWVRGNPQDDALAAVAEIRPHRVLDAGCGDGLFARMIAAPTVIAVDSSEAMVDRARSRGVDARLGDIHELAFDDGEFDVVTCNWTLYHLRDLERGVGELARVTRSGGRLVGVYNREGHMDELWSFLRPEFTPDQDYTEALRGSFGHVEHRDTDGYTLWESRDDLQAYLDAFVGLIGPLDAPPGPYPFRVTRRNRIYVADKR
jgi:SAM-dependent methyltransferase